MLAIVAGKGKKGSRIQPPVLLNFSIHPRSQHCALNSAVILLGHHCFALFLFIWGQTHVRSTFRSGKWNAHLVFIQILYYCFIFLHIQISIALVLCLVIASNLICLDLSCLCSGNVIPALFLPFWSVWGINMNYMNWFLSFFFVVLHQSCINTKP